jgi:hypothetical protein
VTASDQSEPWVDLEEASALLEASTDQVQHLVDLGLLTISGNHGQPRFYRPEVLALRELGA